ncbi:MAG: pantoate--beta-alanine ligase [Chloroflexi bacterium]|nr:pantoate--beta-alanine ligase [Chloroflexota bacterium]
MQVIETLDHMRAARSALRRPIGFVPTMGYLHDGHVSLIHRAHAECASVVVSIFVNPTQFLPGEDYERYPRDTPRDLALCEKAAVSVVFAPTPAEVYPPDFASYVEVTGLQDRWEGAIRPGHFRGVATVVAKLFRIVQAERAYFGEKDYQQLQIVRRMALDLCLDTDVISCPTIREPDGLAMSSRNVYLSADDRQRAVALFRALSAAQSQLLGGETSGSSLSSTMKDLLVKAGLDVDYAAVVHPSSLEPLERIGREARALLAARLGPVRLIDNAPLRPATWSETQK